VAQFDLCRPRRHDCNGQRPISCRYRQSQSRIVSIANRIASQEIDATGLLPWPALIVTSRSRSGRGPSHRCRTDMLASHVIFVHTLHDRPSYFGKGHCELRKRYFESWRPP
jgi:hypothetical protein